MPSKGRYNLTVSDSGKFVWFRVAKVGTRSILRYLKKNNVHLDIEHGNWLHYPDDAYTDYFKFAFVRNPWDRLVSCWRNKVIEENVFQFSKNELVKMQDLEYFIDYVRQHDIEHCDRHFRLQSALIDLNRIDYLGRMESFHSDFSQVMQRLNLPGSSLERINASRYRLPYEAYYTDKMAEDVAGIYKKDIQNFAYTFE